METLKDILWPVVLVGGLGAFIDFLIGKAGQERAKDFLLRWWVRFDDVRWRNFGREEGFFAGRLIETWFGKRIWSLRRITSFAILSGVNLLYIITISSLEYNFSCGYCHDPIYYLMIVLFVSFLAFSVSISVTKFITFRMAYLCNIGEAKNLIIFAALLIINCLMLVAWAPITFTIREMFLYIINPHSITPSELTISQFQRQYEEKLGSIDNLTLATLPLLTSLFRLLLSIVFVGSFLMKPLVIRPVSLVWARIVESEKPVFTLVFGGAAAFATAISEAAKHFSG